MTRQQIHSQTFSSDKNILLRQKLGSFLFSDPDHFHSQDDPDSHRVSNASDPTPHSPTNTTSPSSFLMSPWNQTASPYIRSPWIVKPDPNYTFKKKHGLIGSIVREEGHIYSLAVSGQFLYTGSDSKNIRVWKNLEDISGFKSGSGLVKAIVVHNDRVFTGHQDGKIRVWKYLEERKGYKRVGSLPTLKDYLKSSVNPKSYVEVKRNKNVPWIKHFDAVSCMSLDTDTGLLYSGSWDKTLKVWRISDSKCLESINTHDDAINSVVVGFDGSVFTGSADGSVKRWSRKAVGRRTEHVLVETLLKGESSVNALAVNLSEGVLYAGSSNGLVSFWVSKKSSMAYGGVLRGHKLAVLCLAVGGRLVLSGSADKSICVWRREEGGMHACVTVLTGHGGPVKCMAVEEEDDGDCNKGDQDWIVYSGSLDNSVKVWRLTNNAPAAWWCTRSSAYGD